MPADGVAFAISLGLNAAFFVGCYTFFAIVRNMPFCKKFYEPRRYVRVPGRHKPRRLPTGYVAWLGAVHRTPQDAVIDAAGMDAAIYLSYASFCKELFIFATFWALATVLPVNLVGKQVARLQAEATLEPSPFTYWLPPAPPGGTKGSTGSVATSSAAAFPDFYETRGVPPAPPALKWWKYRADVPPLPPAPPGYGWKYDETKAPMDYDVSNLDRATISNVARGSPLLLIHTLAAWAVTLHAFRLLWKYSTRAVALRIRHLTTTAPGAETHSVLVTDVPGVEAGTVARRLDETVFRALPPRTKRLLKRGVSRAFDLVEQGVAATAGRVTGAVIMGEDGPSPGGAAGPAGRRSGGGGGGGRSAARGRSRSPGGLTASGRPRGGEGSGSDDAPIVRDRYYDAIDLEAASAAAAATAIASAASGLASPGRGRRRGSLISPTGPRPASPGPGGGGHRPRSASLVGFDTDAVRAGSPPSASPSPPPRSPSPPDAGAGMEASAPASPGGGDGGGGGSPYCYRERPPTRPEPANRPPPDQGPYVARTEIAAWTKAAATLAEGVTTQQLVARQFGELFPGQVAGVHVVYTARRLAAAQAVYATVARALTDLLDEYTSQTRRHLAVSRRTLRVRGSAYGAWGRARYGGGLKAASVDALDFHTARLMEARAAIGRLAAGSQSRTEPAAFVTFKTRRSAVLAASALVHHDVSAWQVQAAPGPGEVIWPSLKLRAWERAARSVAGWGVLAAFSLLFLIPVVALQSLLQLPELAKRPALARFVTFPLVESVVQCILPALVLNLLIAGVPLLLARLARAAGAVSLSAVDWAVAQQYFVFLAVTVFAGSFISGSVLNQIALWVRRPSAALNILGASAPMTSQYFLSFIVFMALAAAPFALLRLPALALFSLKTATAGTERAKARLWQDQFQAYGPRLPRLSLVLLLGVTFTPINPIVPPACLLYFLMVSLTEKYNLLYVQRERFQSGGLAWPLAQRQVTASLLVAQVTLVFILAVKGAPWAAALVVPLIPATLLFRSAARALVDQPFSVLSLRAAVDLDANDAAEASLPIGGGGGSGMDAGGAAAAAAADLYRQPDLVFDEVEHEALLAEAAHMDALLKSEAEARRAVNDLNFFGPAGARGGGGVRLPPSLGGAGPDPGPAVPRVIHKRTGVEIEI